MFIEITIVTICVIMLGLICCYWHYTAAKDEYIDGLELFFPLLLFFSIFLSFGVGMKVEYISQKIQETKKLNFQEQYSTTIE